jgi:N-acetylmuramoyl-L-alanine amidase
MIWVHTRPSPNHSARRGQEIRWVVLHADVSPKEQATVSWICSERSQVSYHLLVHRDGTSTRFVPDDRAAWACGSSEWQGVKGLNRHTLSLAFANRHDGTEALTPAQKAAARYHIARWRELHPTIEGVLTHRMVSPHRKSDPHQIPDFALEDFTA